VKLNQGGETFKRAPPSGGGTPNPQKRGEEGPEKRDIFAKKLVAKVYTPRKLGVTLKKGWSGQGKP